MNQNWRHIFTKKLEHFKALIVNNKSKLQQQNEISLQCMCINTYCTLSVRLTHNTLNIVIVDIKFVNVK